VVVDRDVQVLPADPPVALRATRIRAERSLAWLPEAAELLAVDVQQLSWSLPLVAACAARGDSARTRQPRAAMPAQHLSDRRGRMRDEAREPDRPIGGPTASGQDRLLGLGAQAARLSLGRRRPIAQRHPATLLVAPQ
jgi:hypothetical protein